MAGKNIEITEPEFALLRCFYPEGRELTLKEIQTRSGYSYERVHSYLKNLTNKKAVIEKRVGKTLVYSLDFKKRSSKIAYLLYSTRRANEFLNNKPNISIALSEIPEEELDFYALFGSYAKGTEKKGSDIDILFVASNKEKIETAIASIKRRHNLNIQAVIIPKTEFSKIKNENPEFWRDLINHGIIFKGYEIFYYHSYDLSNKKE